MPWSVKRERMTMSWLPDFRRELDEEFAARPRIATLATADEQGVPHARTVVCRRIDEDGSLHITSDARSRKNHQLRERPMAELVFWLASQRIQYRFRAAARVLDAGPLRERAWRDQSDEARALFVWPAPGEPRTAGASFPAKIPATDPPPPNFELLILTPTRTERLSLQSHPHRRILWSGDDPPVELNP